MALTETVILINGQYYAGESEEVYNSNAVGGGWHNYRGSELNVLKLTDNKGEAKVLDCTRNLNSAINKVMQRVNDGYIQLEKIEIVNIKEEI